MSVHLAHVEIGSGPPLIVLHGLFGNKNNWLGVAKALSSDHRVFCLDLRNHGQSPWVEGMSYDRLAEDIAFFIHRHCLAPCRLLGHSMGGKAAMSLALGQSHLIDKLAVVDMAPAAGSSGFEGVLKAMIEIPLNACARRAEVDARLAKAVEDDALRAFLMHNLKRDKGGFQWRLNLRALRSGAADIADFPNHGPEGVYHGPCLFILGGDSDYVLPRHMRTIRRLFPAAQMAPIPGAGHWVHTDAPGPFLARIRAFLAEER